MAEDFNIRISADTSDARSELAKFKKFAMDSARSTKQAMSQIINISDSFSATDSINELKKLTGQIVKLKKAAGDKGVVTLDSNTSLAKVVENALKPSKAKGSNASEIKRLQKQLSKVVSAPSENITQVTSLLETMRGTVSLLSRPNKQAAKEAAQLRRELDNLRKELTVLSRSVNAGTASPQDRARKTQLESSIPKTQARLASAIAASKPSGEMKRMLEVAQRGVIQGTENLQNLLENLVDFAETLDQTTTGAISGAGQDLLSGNAVRSLAKNLQAATGSNASRAEIVRAVTSQVINQISAKPSRMSKPLSREEQKKLQGRSSIRQYQQFGAGAFADRQTDQTSSSGVMHDILASVLQNMYPDRARRGEGIGVTFKGLGDEIAKLAEGQGDTEDLQFQEGLDSLTEALVNGLEEMIKKDDAEQAASYKGRTKRLSAAQASVKEAFGSMQTVEGNPDEEANRKELEAWVRGQLKELSFGARGGRGGKRIGGSFVPTQWDKSEKTGGYMEGGYRAKDMNMGFFPVEEATAMQDGFQYATITAQEFADAMLIAVEVFGELQKVVPNPSQLVAYAGHKVSEIESPAPKLTQEQIAAWIAQNPQDYRPGGKLGASEAVFGRNTIGTTISAMIDAVNKKFIDPTGDVSEINSVIDLFEKLSPSMQNFIGLIEDIAVVEGRLVSNFKSRPGEDEALGLNLSGPHMNTLEQLFSSLNFNPSTTIAGHKYQGGNYPGVGITASALKVPILDIAKELKKDFAAIYGGDMMAVGGKKTTVDPRTFRPSSADDAIEMKAIDAFVENRRAFIDFILKSGNRFINYDITMGLPNVERAFDSGSETRFGGPGATGISYGELTDAERLYAKDPITTRGRARKIFGGAKAEDAGVNTVDGIRQGLKDGNSTLEVESRILAETLLNAFEQEMGIQSPSKEMYIRGQYTVDGLLKAIKDGKAKVTKAGKDLAKSFHSGYTEEERLNAVARIQDLEKQGLGKPAAALRASMSTPPVRDAASSATDIAMRNKEAARLIDALAGVEGALIAFDDEKTAASGMFGVSMVGGTGKGDTTGIYHNMVVPPNFRANASEAGVLGLEGDPTAALKKRVKGLGYGPQNINDPSAQRKMAEDLAYLIQRALEKNIPIAMHNSGYSDWNDLIKLMEKFQIDGAPARDAASRGLLIETQGTAKMAAVPGGKKLEELYTTLFGKGFSASLRPGMGNVPTISDKAAVAHDPTIDASATLEIAFELKKILQEMGFQGKGIDGRIIKAIEGGWEAISELVLGARTHGGAGFASGSNQFKTKALAYKGLDGGKKVDPQAAMRTAQTDAKKAVTAAGTIDRLTREERNVQIQQRLNIIEELKLRLKALLSNTAGVAGPSKVKAINELQKKINAEMADPTISKEWQRRMATSGGIGGGAGAGSPISSSGSNQGFEAEAKRRAVASKKIQGQMKDEMSIMAEVERYNRKMMDSWISGRYALYDMANTYQQFTRAGMKVATFLKQAILLNSQYETSFTGVERVMQPLSDEIAGMRNEIVKLSTELPVAFDELSRISTLAGQMGITAERITEFTKEVSQFGTVTGIATDEVAAKFGSLSQLMHTATDPQGFQKLGSAVAYTGINAVATDQEILSLAESIASATTQAGFAAEETIGLSTALSSLRVPPEQARGVITRLFGDINRAIEGGGKPLQAYARQMGLTTEEAQKLWRSDPQAFFKSMLDSIKGAENLTLALDALNIKETREVNTITRLSENMNVYNKSMRDAAEAYKSGTFLAEAYGKSQDNVATKIILLQNQFKTLQDSIGEALGPAAIAAMALIEGGIEGLTAITKNPVGAFAVNAVTAITAMIAAMITLQMVNQKATASMLAFRTGGLALAKMGGGESGWKGFLKQLTGQEVLIVRSNGRIEALSRKRLELAKKAGEINIADTGSAEEKTLLSGADPRRSDLESTDDIIAQKNAMRQATLDETNQDRISTSVIEKNTTSRQARALATRQSAVAAKVAAGSAITEAEATILSSAAINREVASRQAKIAALAAENVQLQASTARAPKEIANIQARIVANNAATASIQREVVALQARNTAAVSGAETVAVVNKKSAMGLGGIVGKIGMWGMVASGVLAIFAGISEAIEGTKINLEEAGGGLASFREAIYADTRAWHDGADAISTYESKVTTTKPVLEAWASGMGVATGATKALSADVDTTTESVEKQTLAVGKNTATWLAQAAMGDSNIQDMFKKFYKVDGPGLGDLAEAAGTKISDIITSALATPGTGATAYLEKNFNIFASGLVGRGSEVKSALTKIAKALDTTTASGLESSKMLEALTEGFSAASDEGDGAGDVIDTVAEKIRTLTDYTGDLSSIMSSAFTIRFGKTEAVDKLTTAWRDLREKVKQAREEIANIQRDINGMQADANILQYQLNIAIKYGDTKRADKLRAEIAAKEQEMTDKNSEMAKAQSEASTQLTGNSEAAIRNRGTLRGLVQDYNTYIGALANTAKFEGLSDEQVKKKKAFLKQQADQAKKDLIAKAKAIGFNESELEPYLNYLNDFKTIVDKLPKELTLKVVSDPGTRAFMEWWIQNKGNFNPTGGAPTTGGGPTTAGGKTTTGDGKVTGGVTAGKVANPLSALEDINKTKELTKAQKAAVSGASTSTLVKQSAEAIKAYEASKAGLFKNYKTTDPTVANRTLTGEKLASFNKDYAEYRKLAAEAERRGARTSTGAPTYKAATAEQIDTTAAAKEAVADALKKQPAAVQEAVSWLKLVSPYETNLYNQEKKAWEDTKGPYAKAKQDFGLPGDMPWKDILAKYPGNKTAYSSSQRKQLPVIRTLQPFADQFNGAWNKIKENVKRGALYRQLLKNLYNTKQIEDLGLTSLISGGYGIPDKSWTPDKSTRYATGGYVSGSGTGTSDSIPARLSNGEYVIRAKAVKAIGVDKLDEMNHAEKFAKGGIVGKLKSSSLDDTYAKSQVLASMGSYERVLKEFFKVAGQKFSINGKNPLRNVKFEETTTEDMGASAFFREGEGFTFGKNSYDNVSNGLLDDNSGDWLSVDELVSHEISHWVGKTLGKFGNYYKKPNWWPKGKTVSDISNQIDAAKNQLRGIKSPDRAEKFNSTTLVPLQKLKTKMLAEETARRVKEEALGQTPYATDVDTWEEFRADALAGAWQRLAGKKRTVNQENFFSTNGSIWSLGNTGRDEEHANRRTQSMLMDMGYAHPIELLKLLNIKVPKQFLGKDWSKEFEGSGIPKFNLGNASGYDDLGTWRLFKPFKSGNQYFTPGPDVYSGVDLDLDKFRQWEDSGIKFPKDKGGLPLSYKDTFATGGLVTGPGTGTSDSIAAMLSNGEFVMQSSAVRSYGLDFMNSLNQQQLTPRYAMQSAAPQAAGAQIVYLSPEDRTLLRAAIDRPVNLYTENARIAQSANAGNVLLAQRGRN